MNQILRVRRPA